jgi:hypothetical protein
VVSICFVNLPRDLEGIPRFSSAYFELNAGVEKECRQFYDLTSFVAHLPSPK